MWASRLSTAVIGLLALIAAAYLTIDVGMAVPISMQSLAVLLVAYLIPDAVAVVMIYILLGLVGLPVLADGACGWDAVAGNSLGYLIGMLVATRYVSWHGRSMQDSILRILQLMMLGTAIILLSGVAWLTLTKSWAIAIEYGLVPYLPGAIAKILLGTLMAYILNRLPSSLNVAPDDTPPRV